MNNLYPQKGLMARRRQASDQPDGRMDATEMHPDEPDVQEADGHSASSMVQQKKRKRSSGDLGNADMTNDTEGHQRQREDIINTQFSQPLMPDDPQVDWRTEDQAGPVQPKVVAKPTKQPLNLVQKVFKHPQELLSAEKKSDQTFEDDETVNARYLTFLDLLCRKTGTVTAATFVARGLPDVIQKFKILKLDRSYSKDPDMDCYAHGLVIWLWLAVCSRTHFGTLPSAPILAMPEKFGALFNAAHSILQQNCKVSSSQLGLAITYWGSKSRVAKLKENRWWKGRTWLTDIPDSRSYIPQPRNAVAFEYLETLKTEGKGGLGMKIMEKEQKDHSRNTITRRTAASNKVNQIWLLTEITDILAAMHTDLLTSLIDGSLSRKRSDSSGPNPIVDHLREMKSRSPEPPSIYLNMICDQMGFPPTPEQWQLVVDDMLMYIGSGTASDELALIVDQLIFPTDEWLPELAKKHLRRYTEWRSFTMKNSMQPDLPHRNIVNTFANAMQNRIDRRLETSNGHEPFEAPVINIGFTINPTTRLEDHREHRFSNYIMNLSEALFEHRFPAQFRIQQEIIFTCWRNSQPWIAEIIFTQLAQGYTDKAQGFSHYTAGCSNRGALVTKSAHDWIKFEQQVAKSGYLGKERAKLAKEAKSRLQTAKDEVQRRTEDQRKMLDVYDAMTDAMDKLANMLEDEYLPVAEDAQE